MIYTAKMRLRLIARLPKVSRDKRAENVKRKIEDGLRAADEGRTVAHEEVKELFGNQ
jgi:predicted transcriptional regulator